MSRNLGSHLRNPNLIVRTTGEEHHYVKPPPYLVERIGQILVSQSRHFPSLDVQIPPPYSTYYVTRSTNSSNHFDLLLSFPPPHQKLTPHYQQQVEQSTSHFPALPSNVFIHGSKDPRRGEERSFDPAADHPTILAHLLLPSHDNNVAAKVKGPVPRATSDTPLRRRFALATDRFAR